MKEKKVYKLKIDQQFKNLIRPLQKKEFAQLEENIIEDGCRDPLITWNGIVIDGHNRYSICTNHGIPFAFEEKEFTCREAAIAWICANQLGRRNISDETRKFLIGKQYASEKLAKKKTISERMASAKQSSTYAEEIEMQHDIEVLRNARTSEKIARENHISHGTVEKYAIYAKALDTISKKVPELAQYILSGQYKISHENIVELSKMSPQNIRMLCSRIEKNPKPFVQYKKTREEIQRAVNPHIAQPPVPSIKNMPKFDPDAEITGLALTIPSWASSINRVRTQSNLAIVSEPARNKLREALGKLADSIEDILVAIEVN